MSEYKYARELDGISDQWHQVVLPQEIFGKVQRELSDLRIYGITEGNDTIEAPYLLRLKTDQATATALPSKIINSVHGSGGYYFTFEVSSSEVVNLIKLAFGEDNFDWRVRLEGSHNQQEWFDILSDHRILSIKNELTDYQFTNLSFPSAKYRYFRMLIPSEKKPELLSAAIVNQSHVAGTFKQFPIQYRKSLNNTKNKFTEIELVLESPLPVSRLKINVADEFDYYRPVTISYLYDSVQTQQGWKRNYHTLSTETLNSLEENEFTFQSTTLQMLKITVQNQDNQPLNFRDFEVKGYEHDLVVRFTQPASYFLVYGDEKAVRPNYDIRQFADKIPGEPATLSVGAEKKISTEKALTTAPLFENKLVLWSIIFVIIGLLGCFTLSMMRKK
ncbi:DUF3999 family protein [Algoriphagus sp. NG3]|uniref:DUF3999 family protein n=1 Tax=Algoriphagus sp. NG3 TaxID=3097546 RepID=UPI002A7F1BFC|nr:DUF3999 family protein [Algoriphagus sp. NG3]WPR77366.1 DUF3999 family protein [Algoriphagus sp. NG3]